jgi:endonuclease III
MADESKQTEKDNETNWAKAMEPLIQLYGKRKHPLDYQNRYQLVVMVVLSAQDSDRHINSLAKDFFEAYPSISHLATATPEELTQRLSSVRNFGNKTKWLVKLAQTVKEDSMIPTTMEELTKLPGIGRKSANVIIREAGGPAVGIIVDLHVVRVAPRLGIVTGDKPDKIEKQLMEELPQEMWNDVGMSISFLGREVCRPTPQCAICVMKKVCQYYNQVVKNTNDA